MEIKGEDGISGERPIILVTNDDAASLRSLVRVLVSTNLYDVRVCAPDSEKSAVSHSIIRSRPLTAQGVETDAVSGTPADCTGSGLSEALLSPSLPDLVLRGINVGSNCGSSDVPCTEDASLGKSRPAKRAERKRWTPTDDFLLISSWLNTSKDGVVGDEQNSGPFWKRIAAYYAGSSKVTGGENRKREPGHCKQRWQKISDMVCKFCGSYEAAKREKRSGQNENDVLKLAHQIFYNDHKKKFTLQHAWSELRSHQKWCEVYIGKVDGSYYKRRKCEDGAQSSSSHTVSNVDGQATKPPPGFEAARDKGKTSIEECKALSEFQSMWTIKEKDFVMKEKLTKINILDTLLGKRKPLSKIEEALKNKLITDMLCN